MGDVAIRGVAWSGAAPIQCVEVSIREGVWQRANLIGHRSPHSWQWWEWLTRVEQPGPLTVCARATDMADHTQPEQPAWNRLGYGGNGRHCVDVVVAPAGDRRLR